MTIVRELITEPAGGRPREPWQVTWTLVREGNRPVTGMVRAAAPAPDRTVKHVQVVDVPAAVAGAPVAVVVDLPATSLIEPAGTRWLRTAQGLDPVHVIVPTGAGPVDVADIVSNPPAAVVSPDDAALLSNRIAVLEAGGVGAFEHIQSTPAATWAVTHNRGRYPVASVLDSTGAVLLADLTYPTLNTATIVHAAPATGRAVFI